jgi:hypothetical protein
MDNGIMESEGYTGSKIKRWQDANIKWSWGKKDGQSIRSISGSLDGMRGLTEDDDAWEAGGIGGWGGVVVGARKLWGTSCARQISDNIFTAWSVYGHQFKEEGRLNYEPTN